jgi:site-specific recombinase XerD
MYGAALRTSEALGLDMADVDLQQRHIRVRNTKFYKTRLVPLGRDVTGVLARYLSERDALAWAFRKEAPRSNHASTIFDIRRRHTYFGLELISTLSEDGWGMPASTISRAGLCPDP